jgi:hypothetical protein
VQKQIQKLRQDLVAQVRMPEIHLLSFQQSKATLKLGREVFQFGVFLSF